MSRSRTALVVLFFAALLVPTTPAHASYSLLCSGYSSCGDKGYSSSGYASHQGTSYWNMYTGTNCTNYVAYRLVSTNGLPNKRPKPGVGNAEDWGRAMASVTDSRPVAGSVAWWGRTGHHVAYVEKVVSSTEILVSESNWSGAFDWRRITKSGSGWPDGFIHFSDLTISNQTKPSILGEPKVGVLLKASGGVWEPKGNTYSYQWLADGKAISGATAKSFTPNGAQAEKDLTVSVTATRDSYPTARATSAAKPVAPGTISSTVAPSISGTPRVDSPLTASPGTWSPSASYTYQWLVDGTNVVGATATTFTPGPEAYGKRVSVRVRAAKGGYTAVAAVSAPTADLAPGVLTSTSRPVVTGTPQVGSRLSAKPGTWSKPGLQYAYQWYVAGTRIDGATDPTFVPRAADVGRYVTVHVTASRTGYETTSAGSSPTADVARGTLQLVSRPTVSGSPRVGAPLTASTGAWTPSGTYSFQWYADGVRITGATGSTFVPTHRELGAKLRVRVTARRDGYETLATQSVNTTAVARGHIGVSAVPTVVGSAHLDSVLRVSGGTHTPSGATLRFQWLRDGRTLDGATTSSHRVKVGDLGHRLSVRVTMSAAGYTSRTVSTSETDTAKATSRTAVSAAKPGMGKVTFTVRVSAPGLPAPDGTVTIRWSSTRTKAVRVVDGKASIALTGQPAGEHTYRFTYGGTSTVTSSTITKSLTIS